MPVSPYRCAITALAAPPRAEIRRFAHFPNDFAENIRWPRLRSLVRPLSARRPWIIWVQ
jgi:hypothetical protein